jgi:DNA polymerase I
VASYLINPSRRQHNLDALSTEYLNYRMITYDELIAGESKKEKRTIDQVPIDEVARYSGEDADITLRLEELFRGKLKEMDLVKLFEDVELPLVRVLARMERNGVALDTGFLRQMSVTIEKEIKKLTGDIYRLAGEEFNINSTQQIGQILFEKFKYPKKRKTKTGYSTDIEVLEALAGEYELPRKLLDYRALAKLKSTYVDALLELVNPNTKRVHTSYNQTVTSTGRLSSSDPNLQNIPIRTELGREIRKAFVAEEKNAVILSADYSQIELRLMAHLAQDATLIKAFENDEDIHTKTAALVFNMFPQMITPELRRRAKVINFGIIYGMGPYGLSKELGIAVGEATLFIQNYFHQYPGVKEYMDKTIALAREQGYVTTLLGRRRYLPEITSPNRRLAEFAERTAINTPLQGTAADLIKVAMIEIDRTLSKRGLLTKMIMQVHDELVFEVPAKEIDTVQKIVRDKMEHALDLSVPIKVDMKAGKNWFEAH